MTEKKREQMPWRKQLVAAVGIGGAGDQLILVLLIDLGDGQALVHDVAQVGREGCFEQIIASAPLLCFAAARGRGSATLCFWFTRFVSVPGPP